MRVVELLFVDRPMLLQGHFCSLSKGSKVFNGLVCHSTKEWAHGMDFEVVAGGSKLKESNVLLEDGWGQGDGVVLLF